MHEGPAGNSRGPLVHTSIFNYQFNGGTIGAEFRGVDASEDGNAVGKRTRMPDEEVVFDVVVALVEAVDVAVEVVVADV